jgi:hypothetical protein
MISMHPAVPETTLCILASLFFTILFLQSGIDKVIDWKGNLEFHARHFAGSPLERWSPSMLFVVTVLEITCGALSLAGGGFVLFSGQTTLSHDAFILAGVIFLALFAGQRLSKDYAGAASLVPYFLAAMFAIWISA